MLYVDKSVKYFIDKLAAKTPAPGGGSVAALLGALGCGLLSMVANYTMARKGFNGYKDRAMKSLKESEKLRRELTKLVDDDIKAYEKVSKVFKKHKDNPVKLEPAMKQAAAPPAKTCICVHKAAMVSLDLVYVSNKYIISDVAVAINALDAAFESAMLNIRLNLKHIKDKRYVLDKTHKLSTLHRDMKKIKTEVLYKTRERMFKDVE